MLIKVLIIGSGGFLGAILRYFLSGWVQEGSGSIGFPYGTLAVNLLGCFLIGLIYQGVESHGLLSLETRMFIFIGFLGSLTTFSTFGNETFNLLLENRVLPAFMNIVAQVFAGLTAVWLGRSLASGIWR